MVGSVSLSLRLSLSFSLLPALSSSLVTSSSFSPLLLSYSGRTSPAGIPEITLDVGWLAKSSSSSAARPAANRHTHLLAFPTQGARSLLLPNISHNHFRIRNPSLHAPAMPMPPRYPRTLYGRNLTSRQVSALVDASAAATVLQNTRERKICLRAVYYLLKNTTSARNTPLRHPTHLDGPSYQRSILVD